MADLIGDYVQRLKSKDETLERIVVKEHTEAQLVALVDCLLAQPDVVKHVSLAGNDLSDETGVKLARYLAASGTVKTLDLSDNRISLTTYQAVAAALRVNTSLSILEMYGHHSVYKPAVDAAFVDALRDNPNRPAHSYWLLCSLAQNDYRRLKAVVDSC